MDFYSSVFNLNTDNFEINAENWSPELAIADILWSAWSKTAEIFYFELYLNMNDSDKTKSDIEIKEILIKLFWDDIHLHLLGDNYQGDKARDTFFADALGNNENTQTALDYCLMHIINIVSKYACDAYLAYCDYPTDNKYMYYLNEANYFKGILFASHGEKLSNKENLRDKMVNLANIRHEQNKIKEAQIKKEIKKIWLSHNWSSYTECAENIYKNSLVNESNYRKIYSLVSKVAKEKN